MAVRPNILLIMTDQQRWDALGCVTNWMQTPNMDRIASEGVRFSRCITNSPVCIPTRRTMATGHYCHNTGVWYNGNHSLDRDANTWMRAIRDAGYRTSLFGKTHLNAEHDGDIRNVEHVLRSQGIDDIDETVGPRACVKTLSNLTAEWDRQGLWDSYRVDYDERFSNLANVVRPSPLPLELYYDTYVGQKSRAYLKQYDRNQPWFCWVSFGGPHEPWDTPEPYASMYDRSAMPTPIEFEDVGSGPKGNLNKMFDTGGTDPVTLPSYKTSGRVDLTSEQIEAMRSDYAGSVSLIDEQIGGLFETIEARGEWDNTVAVLVSDHGEMNGDFGLIYKSNFMNSAARVPLLVKGPEIDGGRVCDSPVEWFDVGPTLAAYAGTELDYKQFAKSLQPCLTDTNTKIRDESLCELSREIMITDEKWKMAVNQGGEPYLLFDLQEDPCESRNLAGKDDYKDLEKELKLRMFDRVLQAQLD
ncbi:MAG: sulfatase-like hydrolase/transferase [Candidatus Latescibacterota bacterium]|nr:sulfatase-like hydrolase/transferase [Candidatus Latescibacterota bacterium]